MIQKQKKRGNKFLDLWLKEINNKNSSARMIRSKEEKNIENHSFKKNFLNESSNMHI